MMANIEVTLLTNKRTRQTIDALDNTVLAQAGGYTVVEGEDNATKIKVNYPDKYETYSRYVYMKNAKCEYDVHNFGPNESEFTLPASMTFRGNTVLVFYAINGDEKVVWLPVIVPVAETGIDYKKVATASEEFLKEVLEASGKAVQICENIEKKAQDGEFNGKDGENGKSVHIRYSANADGHDMTIAWSAGQRYLGTLIADQPSDNYQDYAWMLFVGDAFCSEDAANGVVSVTLMHDTDKTLTSNALTSITITIPQGVKHGFYAGLNFRTGATPPKVLFFNNSGLPLKIIMRGALTEAYTPGANKTVQGLYYCDGLNVYCYINEV